MDNRPFIPFFALIAATVMLAQASGGQGVPDAVSLGHANAGSLVNGVRIPDRGVGFFSNYGTPGHDAKYGTEELISALAKVGADVERWAPGATLYVNDLSLLGGGKSPRHESHQAGRDADLLFYALDPSGAVVRPRAVNYDGRGRVVGSSSPRVFDTHRNWLVLRSLIENQDAHFQRAIVSEPLRELLLNHARAQKAPAWIIERAGEVMCSSWSPHSNHFHIRLFCTSDDYRRGCRDEWPMYPWRRTELAAAGILDIELAEDPNRNRPRAKRWLSAKAPRRTWCQ